MKISKDTLNILKSFATINPCMYFGDEEALRVISTCGAVIGVYKTAESLDHDCVFWDMPQLISTINSMSGDNAELDFQEKFVKITSPDKSSLKYFYTNPLVVERDNPRPKAYNKYCKKIDADFTFDIPSETLSKVMTIAKNLNLTKMNIEMKDGEGKIHVLEDSNKVDHSFSQDIQGEGSGKISLWIDSLHLIGGDYTIESNKMMAKFINKDIPLFFIVGASK